MASVWRYAPMVSVAGGAALEDTPSWSSPSSSLTGICSSEKDATAWLTRPTTLRSTGLIELSTGEVAGVWLTSSLPLGDVHAMGEVTGDVAADLL
jgi:hypothetical protein